MEIIQVSLVLAVGAIAVLSILLIKQRTFYQVKDVGIFEPKDCKWI